MTHDWIVEVLDDIANYARDNGLPRLALCLDDACATSRGILAPTYLYCPLPTKPQAPKEPDARCLDEAKAGEVLAFQTRAKK